MTFISSLDNFTSSQLGEKGTNEHSWSNNIQEQILQLNFQLTRTNDNNIIKNLSVKTDKILTEIISLYKTNIINREEYLDYMSIMFRTIVYTRDIVSGKGEYMLSFMLLDVFNNHFPQLAYFAFKQFVMPPDDNPYFHPYGSWKDIKYLFHYLNEYSINDYSLFKNYIIQLVLEQLKNDIISPNPSLLCKWIPREKSKFGPLFTLLASSYFNDYIISANDYSSKQLAILKAKTEFRKLISNLNKKINTIQINQCSSQWSNIDPCKVTSITFLKQKRAFLNIDCTGQIRNNSEDRILFSNKIKEYTSKALDGETIINGKRICLNHFTSEAIRLFSKKNTYEANILNAQWLDNSNQNNILDNFIPILDVSNIHKDSFNAAIALGIRIAEKSFKRILTFSANPSWINLEQSNNFIEMVEQVFNQSDYGLNTNFSAALKLIIDAIISQKLNHEQVENMVLAIISDMQMDSIDSKYNSLIEYIEKQFTEAGQKLWHKPFKVPHIIFWNIRSTNGFPALSINNNCSMISGLNPLILNNFCKNKNGNKNCTPWQMFKKVLDNPRYAILDQYIRQII
jgi:hypothetical protein